MDGFFADFALDAHIPGVVYGIVANGQLVHVRGPGVQDLESNRPVTADSLFRIASMTKAFTALPILRLRDEGKLQLDALAETYVPELRGWKHPTGDSRRIRVRDLLNPTAGFVTDDPWGDRQSPLPETEFSLLLREGVPFNRAPAMQMEYANLGFALLGRVITNVSGRPHADTIAQTLLQPLGMASSGFFVNAVPLDRLVLGYRWEDDRWRLEPTLAHGAFGAMGGVVTSANDYAKWVTFLLSAWSPRDDADLGPVKRATVRELAEGSNFPELAPPRPSATCERGGDLRDGNVRARRLRTRAIPQPRRRLPGLWIVRDAAARSRCSHIRVGQSDLRGSISARLQSRGRTAKDGISRGSRSACQCRTRRRLCRRRGDV